MDYGRRNSQGPTFGHAPIVAWQTEFELLGRLAIVGMELLQQRPNSCDRDFSDGSLLTMLEMLEI